MMEFMGLYTWVIPSWGLPFPSALSNNYYRPTRTYRLNRNCRINYYGASHRVIGQGVVREVSDTTVLNIEPDWAYLIRSYAFLKTDCRKLIDDRAKGSGMKYLPKLIKKFKRLEFLDDDGAA